MPGAWGESPTSQSSTYILRLAAALVNMDAIDILRIVLNAALLVVLVVDIVFRIKKRS